MSPRPDATGTDPRAGARTPTGADPATGAQPADVLRGVPDLEAVLGPRPQFSVMKVISRLDHHCRAWLASATLAIVGSVDENGARIDILGGPPGVFTSDETGLDAPGLPADLPDGCRLGGLVLVPGVGETLRVNGRLRRFAGVARLEVTEAYVHCAKALLRSRLWSPADGSVVCDADDTTDTSWESALLRSPFLAVASCAPSEGGADVSPRGDPAPAARVLDDGRIVIPDRPGNRRTDTMRNLLVDPRVAVAAFVPGSDRVARVRGRASLSTDPALRAAGVVRGHEPDVVIVVEPEHADVRTEPALGAARLWDASRHVSPGTLPRASRMWVDHVRASQTPDRPDLVPSERDMADDIAIAYRDYLY